MTMLGDQQEITLGEIARAVRRIEEQLVRLDEKIEPVGGLRVRMDNAERNLVRLDAEMAEVTKQANRIAGAGALLAILVSLMPLPWKR